MVDYKKLIADLNTVLIKHKARIFIGGYDSEVWLNWEGDDWAHEGARLACWQNGRLVNVEELYK